MNKVLNSSFRFFSSVILMASVIGPVFAGGLVNTDFDINDFGPNSENITNSWWPLDPQGTTFLYFAETEDGCAWNLIEVKGVKNGFVGDYAGLEARIVFDREWESEDDEVCEDFGLVTDDELVEETYDWYAQSVHGDIWYLGEESFDFECECSDGSWEAGKDVADTGENAEAGIVMLDDPMPGLRYQQEYYADEAEDWGKVLRLNAMASYDDEDLDGCLMTKEWTPLERGEVEHKYYCEGIGLVLIQELKGKTVWVELVETNLP